MTLTLTDALTRLAHSRYARSRALAALHPETPAWCLPPLARDPNPRVRAAIASRQESLVEHRHLASDPDPLVRRAIADNPSARPALRRHALEFAI